MVAGLAVLLLSWLLLSLAAFVNEQFRRSPGLGMLTLFCFGSAFGLMVFGLAGELRAFRALRRVDHLRSSLGRADAPIGEIRALILPWLHSIRHNLIDSGRVTALVERATSTEQLRTVLSHDVVGSLWQAAEQAGRRAALEGGAVVAITPAPALEGVLAGLRGLLLIRQVAAIFGVRPTFFVMLTLLRRVAWTAASVSGLGLLSQVVAQGALHNLPVIKHLMNALPETSLATVTTLSTLLPSRRKHAPR